ncbi:hypothetical protein GF323_02245 [Candidatus Woesearchaeota archaeon]|nr:hypothetical protein [Candidatus Woesearchaeota archaeon]
MKELFDKFERIGIKEANKLKLIDTCFFISVFEHHENIKKFRKLKNKAITSFNVLELIKAERKLSHLKHGIRRFLEKMSLMN